MAIFVKKKKNADSFYSHGLVVPSLHPSLRGPRTHWYVALFEVVGETEIQVLPIPGAQGRVGVPGRRLEDLAPELPTLVAGSVVFIWRNTGESLLVKLKTDPTAGGGESLLQVLAP